MYRAKRRLHAIVGAVVGVILLGAVATPAGAAPPPDPGRSAKTEPSTMTLDGYSFLEINKQGALVQWTNRGSGYYPTQKGNGWGYTRHIAGLGQIGSAAECSNFVEVKGDELVEWIDCGSGYQRYHRDWGWSNARVITGLDANNFLEIKTDGSLWQWTWNGWAFIGAQKGNGWGNTRLLAGLGRNSGCWDFLEVKGDELVEWIDCGSGYRRYHRDWGWSNARLIAGVNADRFVEVKTDGTLWEWNWAGTAFNGWQAGNGWGNARLIG